MIAEAKSRYVVCDDHAQVLGVLRRRIETATATLIPIFRRGTGAVVHLDEQAADFAMACPVDWTSSMQGSGRLLAECVELSSSDASGNDFCLVFGEDECATAAAAYAIVSGKRLVCCETSNVLTELERLPRDATVMFAGAFHRFIPLPILRVRAICRERNIKWGLLGASSAEAMERSVSRLLLPGAPAVESLVQVSSIQLPGETGFLHVGDTPSGKLGELAGRRIATLVMVGHGRVYCCLGGNLCCRTEAAGPLDDQCTDGFACRFPGTRREPLPDLNVELTFLSSCASGRISFSGPRSAHGTGIPAMLFERGSRSVIAPFFDTVHDASLALLAADHVSRRMPVGAIRDALEDALDAKMGHCGGLMLYGDPCFIGNVPAPSAEAPHDVAGGTLTVSFGEGASKVIHVPDRPWFVRSVTGSAPDLVKSVDAIPVGDGTCLVVTAKGAGVATLSISREAVVTRTMVEGWRQFAGNLSTTAAMLTCMAAELGQPPWPALGQIRDFSKKLEMRTALFSSGLASRPRAPREFTTLSAAVTATETERRAIVDEVCDAARQYLWAKGPWMPNRYALWFGGRGRTARASTSPCHLCGSDVEEVHTEFGLNGGFHRQTRLCQRCDTLSDSPSGEMTAEVKAPSSVVADTPFEVCVSFPYQAETGAPASVALCFETKHVERGWFTFLTPDRYSVGTLTKATELSFRVVVSSRAPRRQYHAVAVVIIDGAFGYAMAPLQIVPPSAHS